MSECGSTKTLNSSNGDFEDSSCPSFISGNEVVLADGNGKYRDGKRWKQRYLVLSKLSPAADCLQLQIYRDEKERARNGHTKASLSLQHFLAMESGMMGYDNDMNEMLKFNPARFTLDKESHTLGIICQDLSVVLAFDNRERLIQWSVRINHNLGEGQQFLVQLISVPPKSKLTPGPVKLHVSDKKFCLTGGIPPKLLGSWETSNLRRYGVVEGRLIFEGGSRCGKGEGVHVLLPDPPQLHVISDALDLAAKGQLTRMPSRRFGNITDSPRKSVINRFSESGLRHTNDNISYPTLAMECGHGHGGGPGWIEGSSRFDIDSCGGDNLSILGPPTVCGPTSDSPSKSHTHNQNQIGQPLPSAMERCLSCMSKLGQLGPLSGPDVLRPSWTMDLTSLNPMLNETCGNGGGMTSDRISLSSHGSSSGGVTEFCYDTPRSTGVGDFKRHMTMRPYTPPVVHHGQGCDSPQRGILSPRAHCTSPPPPRHQHYQCNLNQCTGANSNPIYYNTATAEQIHHHQHLAQKSCSGMVGTKTSINQSFVGPYENYDFPKDFPGPRSTQTINPNVTQNCCNGICNCNGNYSSPAQTSSLANAIDWSKKLPMDRSSIASSMLTSDLSAEWYDTPRRYCGMSESQASQNRQTPCSCCSMQHHQPHYSQPRSCNSHNVNPPRDPLQNYDFPPQKTTIVDPHNHQRNPTSGIVNGEGKMPLVTASVPLKIPTAQQSQPLYAQVDKAKKTLRPNCDINNCPASTAAQPLYANNIPEQTEVKSETKAIIQSEIPQPQEHDMKSHSNYVNLEFAESLQLYKNSKEIRSSEVSALPSIISQKATDPDDVTVTYENLKGGPDASESSCASARGKPDLTGGPPLRRSSSVPCKGGHANRSSASSSDSGVSGDGALYFDDSSPINELGSLCLHESLPRKNQRISPTSSGKELSTSSTPKEISGSLAVENKSSVVEEDNNYTEIVEPISPLVGPPEQEKSSSPRHYETIDERETYREGTEIRSAPCFRSTSSSSPSTAGGNAPIQNSITQLKNVNPRNLVSDANSTSSSGASDMSDYLETLSSCSRGSLGETIIHSNSTSKNPFNNSHHHHQSKNISASPKRATNMKPRSGKEYFKIDRSQFK